MGSWCRGEDGEGRVRAERLLVVGATRVPSRAAGDGQAGGSARSVRMSEGRRTRRDRMGTGGGREGVQRVGSSAVELGGAETALAGASAIPLAQSSDCR